MAHDRFWADDEHVPRSQVRTIGKQEGTLPKKMRGKKRMRPNENGSPCLVEGGLCLTCGAFERREDMNINDKMRTWRDIADAGTISEVRRTIREMLDQFQSMLGTVPATPQGETDVADAGRIIDAIMATVQAYEQAKRKTIEVKVLRDIIAKEGA